MIAAALALFTAAWLWWSGIDVPPDPAAAAAAWAAATFFLFAGYLGSGRRLPAAVRAGRAGAWAATAALAAAACGAASGFVIDRAGPWLSWRAAPPGPVAALGRLAGIDAHAAPGAVVVQDLAAVPAHAVSWQQMGIPAAAWLFATAGLASACRLRGWLRGMGVLAAVLAAWIPVRFLLVTRLVEDLDWLGAHWHPAAAALGLLPAAWLALRLRPLRGPARPPALPSRRGLAAWAGAAAGAALLVFALAAEPSGVRAGGRVLMDDAHSDWEWTGIPFDAETYGRRPTYSYVSLVDFLSHHYQVDSNRDAEITDALLGDYDVLILKTPTRAFLETERDAVVRFVERGGGLLLISDHTNLFGMTTYINPIGEPFGVEFLTDDTFDLTTGAPSSWAPPRLGAHPAVVHVPGLGFETSCTLRPRARLRPVIVGRGLGSEPADYSHVNFFGDISPDPEERWGVFLQAAAARKGRGRVLAFTDSTVFSSFSMFFRGKPELALGMVEFLNRKPGRAGWLVPAAALPGIVLLAAGCRAGLGRGARPARAVAAASAAAAGILAGGAAASAHNAAAYPLPAPAAPMTVVAFVQRDASFRLATLIEASVPDPDRCFDAFFVATQRLHLFPRVAEDLDDALRTARVVVYLNPEAAPSEGDRARLDAWVRGGGRLLVMESTGGSHVAANRILEPAGIRISAAFPGAGGGAPEGGVALYGGRAVDLDAAAGLAAPAPEGGDAAPAHGPPRLAVAEAGRGIVAALLGSEKLSLAAMGPAFNDPSPDQLRAYVRTYALFEKVLLPEGWERPCPLRREAGGGRGGRIASLRPEPFEIRR